MVKSTAMVTNGLRSTFGRLPLGYAAFYFLTVTKILVDGSELSYLLIIRYHTTKKLKNRFRMQPSRSFLPA